MIINIRFPKKMRIHHKQKIRQAGLTLVELLVAMAIGLIIVLAATAALLASRSGATAVDAASQLRDSARFATDLIQRLGDQAGFEDYAYSTKPYRTTLASYKMENGSDFSNMKPSILGFDNAKPSPSDPLNTSVAWSATSPAAGSDTLILQYQAATNNRDSTTSDNSMIVCDGTSPSSPSASRDDRLISVLYVDVNNGEPSLMCITKNPTTGLFKSPTPLLGGVERFQVLYGVDNVNANTAPTGNSDSVPDRYLRADQLTVSGNAAATNTNWRRVRSLRIGLVLRGPVGSAFQSEQKQINAFNNSDLSSSADAGTQYTPTDSRLRQVVTFTVQLRNCQNQGFQPNSSTTPCDVVMP